ncbi:MAG: DinB family protein [Candidatus Eisenbacteria bacterium]|uniref:DinB family protein n=1 Tax=Eiseniibacteriota bacterium TaxID=2212470 RepID=A0A849SNC6_UNCEI|nr:DinB family protein [Candidatus Eisenbacteria bacterium]
MPNASTLPIPRPAANEYAPYYGRYIDRVTGDDALASLESQIVETLALLAGLDDARSLHRYAPGKWSVKEVVGHLTDAERVFAYRALRFARADRTPLPGFDENVYVPEGRFDARPMRDIASDFRLVREASLALFRSLDAEALVRVGEANQSPMSVRALAWVLAGHELHHVTILRERYGL